MSSLPCKAEITLVWILLDVIIGMILMDTIMMFISYGHMVMPNQIHWSLCSMNFVPTNMPWRPPNPSFFSSGYLEIFAILKLIK